MKILFLDFDGVLNSEPFLMALGKTTQEWDCLDPVPTTLLDGLCARTGAKVVVSSSWRYAHSLEGLTKILRVAGFTGEVIGVTPDATVRLASGTLYTSPERGHEIQAWLDRWASSENVEAFAILDDNSDMAHLHQRLVLTDFREGLTEAHVERVVKLLGASPAWPLCSHCHQHPVCYLDARFCGAACTARHEAGEET